jgi:hypothetical protein
MARTKNENDFHYKNEKNQGVILTKCYSLSILNKESVRIEWLFYDDGSSESRS